MIRMQPINLAPVEANDMSQNERASQAIRRAQSSLADADRNRAGYWVGELEADATVTAGSHPADVLSCSAGSSPTRQRKAIAYVLQPPESGRLVAAPITAVRATWT